MRGSGCRPSAPGTIGKSERAGRVLDMDFLHLSRSLRQTFAVRASEWALALMLLNWSVVLSASPNLFTANSSYAPMAAVMDQETWVLVCFVAGAGRLLVLFINGSWRRTPHL